VSEGLLFIHAAAVSQAAVEGALARRPLPLCEIRHALVPGLVDPTADAFAEDDAAFERILAAVRAHASGNEARIVLSCSVYNGFAPRLGHALGIPVERSDDAGARVALAAGDRIALAVSYPPSREVVARHIRSLAAAAGRTVSLRLLFAENAFSYADEPGRYGGALAAAAAGSEDGEIVFLAQYSMDPYAAGLAARSPLSVVSALGATLDRLRSGGV
jgi:hypothetical protein